MFKRLVREYKQAYSYHPKLTVTTIVVQAVSLLAIVGSAIAIIVISAPYYV